MINSTTDRGPDFVIAGVLRGGTTALVDALDRVDGIRTTRVKEPYYWYAAAGLSTTWTGPGDAHVRATQFVTETERYTQLFDAPDGLQGEATAAYYLEPAALQKLWEAFPSCRVIISVRNPIDRCVSAHAYLRSRGLEPEPDVRRALELEADRASGGWAPIWHYARGSHYAACLPNLVEMGGERLLLVRQDDLLAGWESTVETILQHLGVAAPPPPRLLRNQRASRLPTAIAARVHSPSPAVSSLLASVPALRRWGGRMARRGSTELPMVPTATWTELRDLFASDIDTVERLGLPVHAWRIPPRAGTGE